MSYYIQPVLQLTHIVVICYCIQHQVMIHFIISQRFLEHVTTGKLMFAVCTGFAESLFSGTRQRSSLPRAAGKTIGLHLSPSPHHQFDVAPHLASLHSIILVLNGGGCTPAHQELNTRLTPFILLMRLSLFTSK